MELIVLLVIGEGGKDPASDGDVSGWAGGCGDGAVHYFDDSGRVDGDGFRVYREQAHMERVVDDPPPAPSRPLLAPSKRSDYVVTLPQTGEDSLPSTEIEAGGPDARGWRLWGGSAVSLGDLCVVVDRSRLSRASVEKHQSRSITLFSFFGGAPPSVVSAGNHDM